MRSTPTAPRSTSERGACAPGACTRSPTFPPSTASVACARWGAGEPPNSGSRSRTPGSTCPRSRTRSSSGPPRADEPHRPPRRAASSAVRRHSGPGATRTLHGSWKSSRTQRFHAGPLSPRRIEKPTHARFSTGATINSTRAARRRLRSSRRRTATTDCSAGSRCCASPGSSAAARSATGWRAKRAAMATPPARSRCISRLGGARCSASSGSSSHAATGNLGLTARRRTSRLYARGRAAVLSAESKHGPARHGAVRAADG